MNTGFKNLSAPFQWAIILVIAGLLALLGALLSLMIAKFGYGVDIQSLTSTMQDLSGAEVKAMKVSQLITMVFLFIGTPVIVALLYEESIKSFYHLDSIKPAYVALVAITIFFAAGPAIESLVSLNKALGITTGNNNDRLIAQLMDASSVRGLLVNIFIFALIPAIGEELIFRGLIQKYLINATSLPWLGIVLAALAFSTFHMEWDYFFPRWFMGILLGIMFYTSRSLWTSILAHFTNNAAAATVFYLYKNGSPLVQENPLGKTPDSSTVMIIGSYVLVFLLTWLLYTKRSYIQNTFTKLVYPL